MIRRAAPAAAAGSITSFRSAQAQSRAGRPGRQAPAVRRWMDGMGVRRLDKARQAPDETPHTSLWGAAEPTGEVQLKAGERAGRWEMR